MKKFRYVGVIGDLFVYGANAKYVMNGDIVEVSENCAPGYRASTNYEEIIDKEVTVKLKKMKVKK